MQAAPTPDNGKKRKRERERDRLFSKQSIRNDNINNVWYDTEVDVEHVIVNVYSTLQQKGCPNIAEVSYNVLEL